METVKTDQNPTLQLADEFAGYWRRLPNKAFFFTLLVTWLLLFNFLGNGTFGYLDTKSLLYWMYRTYNPIKGDSDDAIGLLILILVPVLFLWKWKELMTVPIGSWWPGLLILAGALVLHLIGYMVQQPRVSIVGLFLGIYGLMGLAWGPAWLKKSFFPFFLFIFCIPISSIVEPITFPLRQLVTKIVVFLCNGIMGMDVIREGTQLFNSAHTYRYEVAAACSGMRSLVAIFAVATVYGFMSFPQNWKRIVMMGSAFPLAVIGNVLRMLCIIIAADVSGQEAGNYVHESTFFSLLPYVPAILGLYFLGRWFDRLDAPPAVAATPEPIHPKVFHE